MVESEIINARAECIICPRLLTRLPECSDALPTGILALLTDPTQPLVFEKCAYAFSVQ